MTFPHPTALGQGTEAMRFQAWLPTIFCSQLVISSGYIPPQGIRID